MRRSLRYMMWMTDIGFIGYWLVIWFGLIPKEYGYQDYNNEYLVDWNLSFIPLDLLISMTGLMSLYYYKRRMKTWSSLCLISLTLTFCSGLQAIAFWGIRADFDWFWWVPNLFLMVYPLFYIFDILKRGRHHEREDISSGY
ncbi:hypothetical protein D3C73_862690 [compost metagenome]